MSVSEQASNYACLLLHDDGISITADKISAIVSAAGIEVESYWPGLFAKLVQKRSVEDLISNAGSVTKLGIPVGFDSTKGKPVAGANVSRVWAVTKRQPRQYMNRRGGFNRPLPPEQKR